MGKRGFGLVAALACVFAPSSQAQTSLWSEFMKDSQVERFFVKPKTLDAALSQSDADVGPRARDLPSDGLPAVVADGPLPHTTWLDERMSRLQAAVDAALPNHLNELQAGH